MSGRDLPDDEARELSEIARVYRRFAATEAQGHSPLYEALTRHIAEDDEILRFLRALPRAKRQPNLLLATVRHLFATPAGWNDFRRRLLDNHGIVRRWMLEHSTQTNEPARCATLLPVLARLPQPLALIEVGASAGLCLLPDYYGYDYGNVRIPPKQDSLPAPIFSCAASPQTPLPIEGPHISWRMGLDLNPLSVSVPEHRAWLEALVWPEQTRRLERLRSAMAIAEGIEPRVVRGDLRNDLANLAAQAPREATLVVFHTAVLAYVSSLSHREAFASTVRRVAAYWIANETASVFPQIPRQNEPRRSFALCVNGDRVAWTDPHGAWLQWTSDR